MAKQEEKSMSELSNVYQTVRVLAFNMLRSAGLELSNPEQIGVWHDKENFCFGTIASDGKEWKTCSISESQVEHYLQLDSTPMEFKPNTMAAQVHQKMMAALEGNNRAVFQMGVDRSNGESFTVKREADRSTPYGNVPVYRITNPEPMCAHCPESEPAETESSDPSD